MFTNQITTNGYQTSFHFAKARKKGQSNWNWTILALMKYHHITILVHLSLVGEMSSMRPTGVGQKSTK